MKRKRQFDDDAFDERGLLKDGHVYRTSMMLMDSQPVFDSSQHRPGFRMRDRMDTAAHQAAYDAYHDELESAYKNSPTGFGERERGFVGARPGDLCTRDGWPGVLRRGKDGALYCDISGSKADAKARRRDDEDEEEAFDEPERRTSDQRRPKPVPPEEDYDVATHTKSTRRSDHRTMDQMMRDHQAKMDRLYDQLDSELSEKWRRS